MSLAVASPCLPAGVPTARPMPPLSALSPLPSAQPPRRPIRPPAPLPARGSSRPREKLLSRGAPTLGDAELLAVLLRTGLPGQPVVSLAEELLDRCGGLAGLLHADARSLEGVKGLGPAKRAMLLAVLEIARRALRQPLCEAPVFESVETVSTFLRLHFDALRAECFAVMFLDVRHRLIALETLFQGTLSHTIAYPREVLKRALALDAAALILVHNHPSGHTDPSPQDVQLTRLMVEAMSLIDVKVLDHFIIGAGGMTSLTSLGVM